MADKIAGKVVNRQELSEILGKTLPTVTAWIKQKMPYIQKGGQGREWQFDTAAVIAWRAEQEAAAVERRHASKEQLERELLQVEIDHKRLKYAAASGEVAALSDIERALAKVFAEVRTGMRNIPRRVAPALVGETDEKRIKVILSDEIDITLEALSRFDVSRADGSDAPN